MRWKCATHTAPSEEGAGRSCPAMFTTQLPRRRGDIYRACYAALPSPRWPPAHRQSTTLCTTKSARQNPKQQTRGSFQSRARHATERSRARLPSHHFFSFFFLPHRALRRPIRRHASRSARPGAALRPHTIPARAGHAVLSPADRGFSTAKRPRQAPPPRPYSTGAGRPAGTRRPANF